VHATKPYGGVKVELLSFLVEGELLFHDPIPSSRERSPGNHQLGPRAGLDASGEGKDP
jgi:hypothetical protein